MSEGGSVVEAVGEVTAHLSERAPQCLQCLNTATGVGLVLQDTEETTDLITSQYNLLLLHSVEGRGGDVRGGE